MKGRRIRVKDMHKLLFRIMTGWARREQLYDRLYSLNWGETTTNNYGFAPADGQGRWCRCAGSAYRASRAGAPGGKPKK